MDVARPARLAKLLVADPHELLDRIATRYEIRAEGRRRNPGDYRPVSIDEALAPLETATGWDLGSFLGEPDLRQVEEEVSQAKGGTGAELGFPRTWDAGITLARLCYALCRARRPTTVVETGVARGVTTAFVLKALEVNAHGRLHSVDPLAREPATRPFVGGLVPEALRSRWQLHPGRSRRVLPKLLPTLAGVDLFVQDSLHTYRTTLWELGTVEPNLNPQAVVLADDIEGNSAWGEWSDRSGATFSRTVAIEGKGNVCGFAVV